MTTYILIAIEDADGQIVEHNEYPTDTLEQIAAAEAAMREAGLAEADVWVGRDDDAYKNGQKIVL